MHKAIRLYWAVAIATAVGVSIIPDDLSITVAQAQQRYREDPKLRKSRARDALVKAMTLNAQVEILLNQGSDEVSRMVKMLQESYGYQVTAIGQVEGIVREASFKDPLMERGILNMYEVGKPSTLAAESDIKTGDYAHALGNLANAKRTHQMFMTLLY